MSTANERHPIEADGSWAIVSFAASSAFEFVGFSPATPDWKPGG